MQPGVGGGQTAAGANIMRAAMGPACCGLSRSLSLPSDSPELRIKPRNIKGGGVEGPHPDLIPSPQGRQGMALRKQETQVLTEP